MMEAVGAIALVLPLSVMAAFAFAARRRAQAASVRLPPIEPEIGSSDGPKLS